MIEPERVQEHSVAVNETGDVSWLTLLRWRIEGRLWAIEHWALTHLSPLHFCPSCGGYFRAWGMALSDKCEACYARDYGVPVEMESAGPATQPAPVAEAGLAGDGGQQEDTL